MNFERRDDVICLRNWSVAILAQVVNTSHRTMTMQTMLGSFEGAISLMSVNCKLALPGTAYRKFLEGQRRRHAPTPFMYRHQSKLRRVTHEDRIRAEMLRSLGRETPAMIASSDRVEDKEKRANAKWQRHEAECLRERA